MLLFYSNVPTKLNDENGKRNRQRTKHKYIKREREKKLAHKVREADDDVFSVNNVECFNR